MKRIGFILLLVILPFLFGLKMTNSAKAPKTVSCYYSKKTDMPLLIYDKINGNAIDTLHNFDLKYLWYNLIISESKKGWFKIDSIYVGPGQIRGGNKNLNHCFGKWVKTNKLQIHLWEGAVGENYKIYSKPKLDSKFIAVEKSFYFGSVSVVNKGWAKVRVKTDSSIIEGWIPRGNQCGTPWTTCCNDF